MLKTKSILLMMLTLWYLVLISAGLVQVEDSTSFAHARIGSAASVCLRMNFDKMLLPSNVMTALFNLNNVPHMGIL